MKLKKVAFMHNPLRPLRALALATFLVLLVACSGIPLSSMPRLMKLPGQMLNADPAEVMFAVQVDQRLLPTTSGQPMFHIDIQPALAGAFEPVQRKLPMQLTTSSTPAMGLAPAAAGRRWMLYRFPAESQAELGRIQSLFKRLQAERKGASGGGGSLSMGIAQDGVVLAPDPAVDGTRWESWLQTSKQEGFYLLWSGTLAELKAQERAARK